MRVRRERFACQKCPAFYECCTPHMKATAGGWKSERIDGKNVLLCIPGQNRHGGQEMRQYAYYCLATPKGKMIAGKADYTGLVPKWCPLEVVECQNT